tara:strand:- start:19592 stop:19951 length:360 start_codon:yes stop_codon:yes gene_type:complete
MIDKLQLFVSAFKYAASADTAYGDYNPDKHGPLHNHCGCVAYAVQQLLGGKIRTGRVHNVKHYWNEIGLGEIDLSASQFGETDIVFFPQAERATYAPARKTINPRFQLFWDRVQIALHQ